MKDEPPSSRAAMSSVSESPSTETERSHAAGAPSSDAGHAGAEATSSAARHDKHDSSQEKKASQQSSWLVRLLKGVGALDGVLEEPASRDDLLDILKTAANNNVVDQEAFDIIEGALDVASRQVREIMISRSNMVVIKACDKPETFLPRVIDSGHSRFPVVGESIDEIKGILLAKDLLPLILGGHKDFKLEDILRPANIIPESKRLNVLLKEFRENRYHMALVIDEYGGISGLVTIEDILEEIVGEIEDETDEDEEELIRAIASDDYIVNAMTPIEDFNEYFKTDYSDEQFDTIGGLVLQSFGHMPARDETTHIDPFDIRILYADSRKLHLLRLTLNSATASSSGSSRTVETDTDQGTDRSQEQEARANDPRH